MTATAQPLGLPTPAGAVEIYNLTGFDEPGRLFDGSSWVIDHHQTALDGTWGIGDGPVKMVIAGVQADTGEIARWIAFDTCFSTLTLRGAEMLAEALTAAVDEAKRMNIADGWL